MPQDDLKNIVQKMIDAGETEENISTVIKHYSPPAKVEDTKAPPTMLKGEPTSFWGGVGKSITSGEAMKAGLEGGLGWAKGAVLDLPSSVLGGLKTIGGLVTDPIGIGKELAKVPGQMWDTAKQAGSNPDAFGRMMGQVGGQPLVTAGLSKVVPPIVSGAVKAAGKPLEVAGRVIGENGSVTGMMPPMAVPKYFKLADKMMGKVVEKVGKKIQGPPAKIEPNYSSSGNIPTPGMNLFSDFPPVERTLNPNPASFSGAPAPMDIPPMGNTMPVNVPVNPGITASMSGQPTPMGQPGMSFSSPSMSSNNLSRIGNSIANPTSDIDAMMNQLGANGDNLQMVPHDDMIPQNNGSGESTASMEAISRGNGMKSRGEQYVVYNKTGQMKPLIGPDAVDYQVRPGESYGILGPEGQFTMLDDAGGISPNKLQRPGTDTGAIYVKKLTPEVAKQLYKKGYKFDSMREDGAYKMIKSHKPPS